MLSKLSSTVRLGIAVVLVVWIVIMVYVWYGIPRRICFSPEGCGLLNVNDQSIVMLGSNDSYIAQRNLSSYIHVCMTGDENTMGGLVAAVNSIYSNTRQPVFFHLITEPSSVNHLRTWMEKTRLKYSTYEIRPFPMKWLQGKIKVRDGRQELASPMNFARFYIPKLFPELKGKIIYIDDDSVVQDDIKDLYNIKLDIGHIAAFSDDCSAMSKRFMVLRNLYTHYINFDNHEIQNVGLKQTACSFNTGVYVFNLDRWRDQNITEQLEHWMVLNTKEDVYGNEKGGGGSQPPMMIVMYNKYSHLNPQWNVRHLGSTAAMKRYSVPFLQKAKLLHWTGPEKPWNGKAPYSHLWEKWFLPDPTGKFKVVRKSGIV